jgi:predicted glycoside hydrolase/deacetylase ChbG (UPF0249 family)
MGDMTSKRIIVNADDIGMCPAVDGAAMRLAEAGIISSVSVMALAAPDSEAMRTFHQYGVDIGLHLDFTSSLTAIRYGQQRTVASTIARAYSGRLHGPKARQMVIDQLYCFQDLVGRMPAFVDGHEHVHQLPVIRDALLDILTDHAGSTLPFVRSTQPQRWRGAKAAVIGLLGAGALAEKARRVGLKTNSDFFGVYNLAKKVRLEHLWQCWLQTMPSRGALVMCHPAMAASSHDEGFRLREYRFLSSALFEDMLYENDTTIVGWRSALQEPAPPSLPRHRS